jgi:hypothetical protein
MGMAMASKASGGTGVGPGANKYFFCMDVTSKILRTLRPSGAINNTKKRCRFTLMVNDE